MERTSRADEIKRKRAARRDVESTSDDWSAVPGENVGELVADVLAGSALSFPSIGPTRIRRATGRVTQPAAVERDVIRRYFTFKGKEINGQSKTPRIHGASEKHIQELAESTLNHGVIADAEDVTREYERLTKAKAKSDAKKPKEIRPEYPFPDRHPQVVYRWCSKTDADDAVKNGIVKYGDIHDGIPTMPNKITKEKAKGGGGVGIVSADAMIEIDLSLIPQIRDKKPNSLRQTTAKGGAEWKIIVTIPAGAISIPKK